MRLIDADKLGEDLTKLWDYSCDEGVSAIAVLKQALLAINNAPTVDVDRFDVTTDDVAHWCATHPDPELKKQYEEELSRAKKLINAPAVEPVKQCKYCKHCGNEDYCSNCHSDHSLFEYYERPQSDMLPVGTTFNIRPKGEWIEKEETPASVSYYCSICKIEGIPITPFCPWCGAEMKGEE